MEDWFGNKLQKNLFSLYDHMLFKVSFATGQIFHMYKFLQIHLLRINTQRKPKNLKKQTNIIYSRGVCHDRNVLAHLVNLWLVLLNSVSY